MKRECVYSKEECVEQFYRNGTSTCHISCQRGYHSKVDPIQAIGEDMGGYITKDSGEREEFDTGSRRDTRENKGRYDLLPFRALRRLAGVYERGAKKYGDRNWELGQPQSRFLDSAIRHLSQYATGATDEDHLAQAAWNVLALIDQEERKDKLPKELFDV